MAVNDWLTEQALLALFNKLERRPIRIEGLDPEGRVLNIWVTPPKISSRGFVGEVLDSVIPSEKYSTRHTKDARPR